MGYNILLMDHPEILRNSICYELSVIFITHPRLAKSVQFYIFSWLFLPEINSEKVSQGTTQAVPCKNDRIIRMIFHSRDYVLFHTLFDQTFIGIVEARMDFALLAIAVTKITRNHIDICDTVEDIFCSLNTTMIDDRCLSTPTIPRI